MATKVRLDEFITLISEKYEIDAKKLWKCFEKTRQEGSCVYVNTKGVECGGKCTVHARVCTSHAKTKLGEALIADPELAPKDFVAVKSAASKKKKITKIISKIAPPKKVAKLVSTESITKLELKKSGDIYLDKYRGVYEKLSDGNYDLLCILDSEDSARRFTEKEATRYKRIGFSIASNLIAVN